MQKTVLQLSMMFVLLVVAQAVIFNHVVLYGIAMPFIFIYFIIKLPINLSPTKVIFLGFLLGMVMDVFQDTPGLCALACTCLAACRRTVFRLYIPREEDIVHSTPSLRTLGAGVFSQYVVTMSLIFCVLVFVIEAFSLFRPIDLLLRVVTSTVLTSVLLIAIDSLSRRSVSEKRL